VSSAEKYVTAVYLVVLAVVLLYVVIYAFKLARLGREVEELAELASRRDDRAPSPRGSSARVARQ
jgi:hypothetical protein